MKSIGYIRVSTIEQANEGVSLNVQRAKIKAYAEMKELKRMIKDGELDSNRIKEIKEYSKKMEI